MGQPPPIPRATPSPDPVHSPAPWHPANPDLRPLHAPLLIIDAKGRKVATVEQDTDCDTENANVDLLLNAPQTLRALEELIGAVRSGDAARIRLAADNAWKDVLEARGRI